MTGMKMKIAVAMPNGMRMNVDEITIETDMATGELVQVFHPGGAEFDTEEHPNWESWSEEATK